RCAKAEPEQGSVLPRCRVSCFADCAMRRRGRRAGPTGDGLTMRTWISKALGATLLLVVVAVAVAAPKHVREQTEASMLLTGTIDIAADGSVRGYSIDHEDKVPDYVLANIAGMVPGWRFEPTLVDGKPVAER